MCSHLKAVNCFLVRYATDAAIAKYDVTILRYMQPASTTPQQFVDDLIAKSCKGADVYDMSTLKDVFIESIDVFIRLSL